MSVVGRARELEGANEAKEAKTDVPSELSTTITLLRDGFNNSSPNHRPFLQYSVKDGFALIKTGLSLDQNWFRVNKTGLSREQNWFDVNKTGLT